jgi:hypothetical protein
VIILHPSELRPAAVCSYTSSDVISADRAAFCDNEVPQLIPCLYL